MELSLISIEETIFNYLKEMKSSDFSTNRTRFEALQLINFEELCSNIKFQDELKTIKSLVQRFSKKLLT